MLGGVRGRRGQMAVELAVLMPAVLVVALVVYNLARFVELCAVFDRVAFDAVLSEGVSPAGSYATVARLDAVERQIERALDAGDACSVEVSATRVGAGPGATTFSLAPWLTRITCTLRFRPWPHAFVVAGVAYDAPVALCHERALVVDRFRPGVVM